MHPELFKIGPIQIYSYGAMMLVAFLAGTIWAVREGKRHNITSEQIMDLTIFLIIGGLVFARGTFILLNLDYYIGQPVSSVIFSQGKLGIQGLSFHGGLFGAILGSLLYAKRSRISWWLLADICAPAAALGYGFARIGCFLNGCCYGGPTDLPWAIRFTDEFGHILTPGHPTQLYSTIGSWIIFGLLIWMRGKLPGRGQLFFSYLGLYCTMRFIMEFFRRGYTADVAFANITQAQVVSIVVFIFSGFMFWHLGKKADINKE